jgi:hypothetical protein
LNVSAWGETTRDAEAGVTVSETLSEAGLLDALGAVIVIVPLYVPTVRPAGLTDTLKVAGVVAAEGLTESQLPPDVTAVNAVAELADTLTV